MVRRASGRERAGARAERGSGRSPAYMTYLGAVVMSLAAMAAPVSAQAQEEDLHLGGRQTNSQGVEVAPVPGKGLAGQLADVTGGGLSAEDIDSLLKDAAGLIDPSATDFSLASANLTESEVGRQLGILRKIQQDLFKAPEGESVENLFDSEFSEAARATGIDPQAVGSLIDAYDRLHTAIHVMKTYAFLAQGPVATYKGETASESVAAQAGMELTRARGAAQAALEALTEMLR